MRRARRGLMRKHNLAITSFGRLLRQHRFTSLVWLALIGAYAQPTLAAEEKWWNQMPAQYRVLFGRSIDADEGSAEAAMSAARLYFRGFGSPEGPKPDVAIIYMEKAADKGNANAMLFTAVLTAVHERNAESPSVQSWLAKYRQALPTEAAAYVSNCNDSATCRDYMHLLIGHFKLFVVYPLNARYDGVEGKRLATIDLEARTVAITDDKASDVFAKAVKQALTKALEEVPKPKDFARKGRKVQMPVIFKLTE